MAYYEANRDYYKFDEIYRVKEIIACDRKENCEKCYRLACADRGSGKPCKSPVCSKCEGLLIINGLDPMCGYKQDRTPILCGTNHRQ